MLNNRLIGYSQKRISLLNNALRKLVLDNDVDTAVSLLKLADETLAKVIIHNLLLFVVLSIKI